MTKEPEDKYDDEEFLFPPENLTPVMELFKEEYKFLNQYTVEELCTKFKSINKLNSDGEYIISERIVNNMLDSLLSDELMELSKQGLLDISIDERGEFLFKLTDEGKKKANEILGNK